jgi:hypothetical protein
MASATSNTPASGRATSELGSEGLPWGTASSPVRWPSLSAEREAVSGLVVQSQAIRQRLLAIVAEAKTRLGVAESEAIDIHLATGLWFKVGDPVPTVEGPSGQAQFSPSS